MQKEPLKGLHVVDFCREIAGPATLKYLSVYGATVVRIESERAPDGSRTSVPPYKENIPGINRAPFQSKVNLNKYGLALNLNHSRAREITEKLVDWADIIAESYVPGQMTKWGLDYESVKARKPDIIMCSFSIQGQHGPHAKHAGMGMQLSSGCGLTHILGYTDEGPKQPYGAYTDWVVPRFAAAYILAALDNRRRTGKGMYIDFSQFESILQFLSPLLLDYSINGREFVRSGNKSPSSAPHGAYRCKGDDRWCVIAVQTDEEWRSFCNVIGNPEWTGDIKYLTMSDRKANEKDLDILIEQWTTQHDARVVQALMQEASVPAGIVATAEDLFNDPQLKHRHAFLDVNHPEIGEHRSEGIGFTLSDTPLSVKTDGNCLGEHSAYVCTEILGISEERFIELFNEGLFE